MLTAINALKRPRQDTRGMQRVSTESGIKINIWAKTTSKTRRAPRPIMANQNAKSIFIWMNFDTRERTRSP